MKLLLSFICVLLSSCGTAQTSEAEKMPLPSPTIRTINAVDIVERADQMCKQENDCAQALLLYDQAIDERGGSTELFKKRGMAHYALKEIDPAIGDFSKAMDLQSREEKPDASLYFMRGLSKSLLEKEDREGACDDIRKALSLGWKSDDKSFDSWFAEYCPIT